MKTRTKARVFAFKNIFINLFNIEVNDEVVNEITAEEELSDIEFQFATSIINEYKLNKEKITEELTKLVEKYELDRVFKVDLALLYLALAEIFYIKTPKPVVINEILEIAKLYSTEKSNSFINGVLSKVNIE